MIVSSPFYFSKKHEGFRVGVNFGTSWGGGRVDDIIKRTAACLTRIVANEMANF